MHKGKFVCLIVENLNDANAQTLSHRLYMKIIPPIRTSHAGWKQIVNSRSKGWLCYMSIAAMAFFAVDIKANKR